MTYSILTLTSLILMLITVTGVPAFAIANGYSSSWMLITMVSSFAVELTGFLYFIEFTTAN